MWMTYCWVKQNTNGLFSCCLGEVGDSRLLPGTGSPTVLLGKVELDAFHILPTCQSLLMDWTWPTVTPVLKRRRKKYVILICYLCCEAYGWGQYASDTDHVICGYKPFAITELQPLLTRTVLGVQNYVLKEVDSDRFVLWRCVCSFTLHMKCNNDNKMKISFEKLQFKGAECKLHFSYTSPQVTEMKSHVADWQTLNKEQRFAYF